jgi:hypothetical protein
MRDIMTDRRGQRTPGQAIREQLGRLTPDQIEAGMVFLSGYDPALFDLVVHAARTWTTEPSPARPPASN